MRLFLFVLALLLPQIGWAQLSQLFQKSEFLPGSYVLSDNPNVRHSSLLKLESATSLFVQDTIPLKKDEVRLKLDGTLGPKSISTREFTPKRISSFRIGQRKFLTATGFDLTYDRSTKIKEDVFVELLDSGRVTLLQYEYDGGSIGYQGAGGTTQSMAGSKLRLLLLRWADSAVITAAPESFFSGSSKKFKILVSPYFVSRPDLARLVEDGHITTSNLAKAVHALNSGESYSPPLSRYEILKQQALAKQAKKAAAADSTHR